MANIEYAFPVEKVHGKISKKHKVGFAHRIASGVNYTTVYGQRKSKPSTAELLNRQKFKDVAAAARERMINPEFVQIDHAGFNKQTKYTTLWGYVFNEVYKAWAEESCLMTASLRDHCVVRPAAPERPPYGLRDSSIPQQV